MSKIIAFLFLVLSICLQSNTVESRKYGKLKYCSQNRSNTESRKGLVSVACNKSLTYYTVLH